MGLFSDGDSVYYSQGNLCEFWELPWKCVWNVGGSRENLFETLGFLRWFKPDLLRDWSRSWADSPFTLQCVAVCCSVLQCIVVCCSVLQCVAVCCRADLRKGLPNPGQTSEEVCRTRCRADLRRGLSNLLQGRPQKRSCNPAGSTVDGCRHPLHYNTRHPLDNKKLFVRTVLFFTHWVTSRLPHWVTSQRRIE